MWLMTPVGFFSVVRKPTDIKNKTLTVRARVRSDLEALQAQYLPELGPIQESPVNDYRFRAVAPQAAVAQAMARLVEDLEYANFKDEVAKRQGPARSHLYHDVWSVLYRLQKQPAAKTAAPTSLRVHPRRDHAGKEVPIKRPSKPSPLSAWAHPDQVAAVLPKGRLPAALGAVPLERWTNAPSSPEGWEALALASLIDEPGFKAPKGLVPAAGVVVQEPDGRLWLVCPTNQFGGYEITFPKGRLDGNSLQATALCEAYEESGLQVRLIRHLVDVKRTQTYTRYYLAERVGGSPADMGWESQCVMLVPASQLGSLNLSPPDLDFVRALRV